MIYKFVRQQTHFYLQRWDDLDGSNPQVPLFGYRAGVDIDALHAAKEAEQSVTARAADALMQLVQGMAQMPDQAGSQLTKDMDMRAAAIVAEAKPDEQQPLPENVASIDAFRARRKPVVVQSDFEPQPA